MNAIQIYIIKTGCEVQPNLYKIQPKIQPGLFFFLLKIITYLQIAIKIPEPESICI